MINLIASTKDTSKTSKHSFSYTISDTTKKHKYDTVKVVKGRLNYRFSIDSISMPKIVTNSIRGGEDAIFVVDGKVVKNNDFQTINPKDITSISVEKGGPDDKGVIYITTKNSAPAITSVRINGYNIKPANRIYVHGALNKADSLKYIKGRMDSVYIVNGGATTLRGDVNRGGGGRIYYTSRDSTRGDQKTIFLDKLQNVTVVGRAGSTGKRDSLGDKLYAFKTQQGNTLNLTYGKRNRENNIENLSSKLIFIDGKEASARDLKKLSAASIESISAQSGDDIVKKYGDKAKDGLLFITTKKAK